MDPSGIGRWANRFVEIRYEAGQTNMILQIIELFNNDDAPRVPFELINLMNTILEQVQRKMRRFPPNEIEEILSWEQEFPKNMRSSLSLEEKAILVNFEHIVHAIQNFAKLQEQVRVWHLKRLPRRGRGKIKRVQ